MQGRRLSRKFFVRSTLAVARELLGKVLVRKIGPTSPRLRRARQKIIRVMIIETEAYCGPRDLASHASQGPAWPAGRRTKRTEIMFGPPGLAYVYLIYGMYYCLNIVTEAEGYPAAVLIRAVSVKRLGHNKNSNSHNSLNAKPYTLNASLNGPGKLCRFLKIDKALNGEDMIKSSRLWIEDGEKLKPAQIGRAKRIGVDYAGSYKHKLWRFFIRSKS
jgi:DNA-3-methyladenine glycosylase